MNEEVFFSSWLREDVEGEAEEMERETREAKEERCKRGKRECKGEKERMAVVCKRACCESHSGMNMDVEVVDLSGDETEHWCDVCVCLLLFLL